ncbi:MAG: methylated-DNA--[protein]-cysteine S-methyltransferase [Clostridiales Family XIII bacterium]|jgi:methylated-DNA-[protein]-cysteine S-methyltransferase|nr:methylated-DNA--[protein]-cysteine S-methyltransferase [Clostridiales Family XIII bacterium]
MGSYITVGSPIGDLLLAEDNGALTCLKFGGDRLAPEGYRRAETPLLAAAGAQLREYFQGKRKTFDLPLAPAGTPFMSRVWEALRDIPYGETRSYRDIAAAAGSPKAFRAVGRANNRNPLAIITPCHRVIGSDGSLVGYGGGLDVKEYLLRLEAGGAR